MFLPRGRIAEQKLVPDSELRVLESISGLFGLEPGYIEQVDRHLKELPDTPA